MKDTNRTVYNDVARPSLLFVGTPRFHNPTHNIINTTVPDVRTPARQVELDIVATALSAFCPTRVAVVWTANRQAFLDERYTAYRSGRYQAQATETEQIGFRVASKIGLSRIDAVDWSYAPPGDQRDYDFQRWVEENGDIAAFKDMINKNEAEAVENSAFMEGAPVSAWLRKLNEAETRRKLRSDYYYVATLGDETTNPGAAWVGTFYARNLRILNNLRMLASPDDRIIAVYGAGNVALLELLAEESGWFHLADANDYLPG